MRLGRKAIYYILDTSEKNGPGHFRETTTRNEFWSGNRKKNYLGLPSKQVSVKMLTKISYA